MKTEPYDILAIFRAHFGDNVVQWPAPGRTAPSLFHLRAKANDRRIEDVLTEIGHPGLTADFREAYHSLLNNDDAFDLPADTVIWRAWSKALRISYEPLEGLEKKPKRKHQAILTKVLSKLKLERKLFIDGETQPVGDMSTMEPEAVTILAEMDATIAAFTAYMENPTDEMLTGGSISAIRDLLKDCGVPQAAFIDDHVENGLWQRDMARKLIVEIWTTTKCANTRELIRRFVQEPQV